MEKKWGWKQEPSALLLITILAILARCNGAFDYGDALSKSLLYFESQRSGRLPHNQRVNWRDHSGLTDGLDQGVSLPSSARLCWNSDWDPNLNSLLLVMM